VRDGNNPLGRKETIIFPPHSPIYSYGAVFSRIGADAAAFWYLRFSFGQSTLQAVLYADLCRGRR